MWARLWLRPLLLVTRPKWPKQFVALKSILLSLFKITLKNNSAFKYVLRIDRQTSQEVPH